MPSLKHIHTYAKFKGKPGFWKCNAPDCTHYAHRELVVGKYSLCNICGAQMKLTFQDMKRVEPRCLNCSNTKKGRMARKALEITQYLGTESFAKTDVLPLEESQDLNFDPPLPELPRFRIEDEENG